MGIYRKNAATETRLDFGTELGIGVRQFDETSALRETVSDANAALRTTYDARRATRQPLIEARVELRFGNWRVDQAIRTFARQCEIADGGRRGDLSKDLLPHGVSPVVAPRGRAQIKPTEELVGRIQRSKVTGSESLRGDALTSLTAALLTLTAAGTVYDATSKAYTEAFAAELAERNDHRTQMSRAMNLVRAEFPNDRERWSVVFPESDDQGAGDDDEEPTPTPA